MYVNLFDTEGGGESSYDSGKLTWEGGRGTEGKHDAFTAMRCAQNVEMSRAAVCARAMGEGGVGGEGIVGSLIRS